MSKKIKNDKVYRRFRIKKRIRSQVSGTQDTRRLSVFRSNKFIYAQLVDDANSKTLAAVSDVKLNGTKLERAAATGKAIAEAASKLGVAKVVFDRNGFGYKGRVKTLADSARETGLTF